MFASKTVARATVGCGNAASSTQKRQTQVRPVAAISAQNSAFLSQRRSCKSDGRLQLSHKNRAQRVRMSSADTVTVASETSEEEKEEEPAKEAEEPPKKVEEPKFSPVEPLYEVALESEMGVDYSKLEDLLKKGDWQAADDETREKLCVIAGEGAAERKWVYFTEVASIPVKDLQTMDKLWVSYSGGRFGYSVQKRLWKVSCARRRASTPPANLLLESAPMSAREVGLLGNLFGCTNCFYRLARSAGVYSSRASTGQLVSKRHTVNGLKSSFTNQTQQRATYLLLMHSEAHNYSRLSSTTPHSMTCKRRRRLIPWKRWIIM